MLTLSDNQRKLLDDDGYIILPSIINSNFLLELRRYLSRVMNSSLPKWEPIERGVADNWRFTDFDSRSHVGAKMAQFNFFPWNQSYLDVFRKFQIFFDLRNQLNAVDVDLLSSPEIIQRLMIQFYPAGGAMELHSDPPSSFQKYVASVSMSAYGQDFLGGGLVLHFPKRGSLHVDPLMCPGDLLLFDASIPHEVKPISTPSGSSEGDHGRWIAIAAITKANSAHTLPNAKTFNKS